MLRTLIAHLRGQWMGALALFLVIAGGTAYAANTVGSSDIIDESILSQDVKNGQVKTSDIGNGQVRTADLATDSVGSDEIATNAVNATEVADSSIDTGEIVDNSLFAADLAPDSVGDSELADNAVGGANVVSNSLTTADIAGADVNGGHISIGAGAVGNGRCRQVDAGVGGAKPGEGVVFSAQGALQNGILLYGQRVPSNGHVTFDVCNFSGTTQDAITSLPVRVITFG